MIVVTSADKECGRLFVRLSKPEESGKSETGGMENVLGLGFFGGGVG